MQKHRIVAFLLTVMLTVSYTLGRSQTARAATALSAQQIEVLYGLLASGGVIAAHEGSNTQKRKVITDWNSAVDVGALSGFDLVNDFKANLSGDYVYQGSDDFSTVRGKLISLRSAFADYVNNSGFSFSVSPPTAWNIYKDGWKYTYATRSPVTVASGTGIYVMRTRWDSTIGNWDAYLYGVTPDGYLIALQVLNNRGTVVNKALNGHGTYVGSDCSVSVYGYVKTVRTEYSRGLSGFSAQVFGSDGSSLGSVGLSNTTCDSEENAVIAWGGGNAVGIGTCDVSGVLAASANALGLVDGNVDCDTWADNLGKSLVDENKDVVIIGGTDLSDYDSVNTVRDGLVTGVDWETTGNPDVPVPGDIPGKLDSILDWLKSLPALLGTALIGDGNIDWSKLQGVQLSSVFPFCIPWDLADCFRGFNVAAVEPVFVFDFSDTPLSAAGSVTLDLSRFAELIPVVRFFVYGLFVTGLVLKTRDLIRG